MNIEYPPMLTGDNKTNISALRSYLFRLADSLNYALDESVAKENPGSDAETEDKNGLRKIYSSDTGIVRGGTFPVTEEANGASFFTALIAPSGEIGSGTVPVILFKRGNTARGSANFLTSLGEITFFITMNVSAGYIKVSQAVYINKDNDSDSGMLPGGTGSAAEGYTIREIYALVI